MSTTNLVVHTTNPVVHTTNPVVHTTNPVVHTTNPVVHTTNLVVHTTNVEASAPPTLEETMRNKLKTLFARLKHNLKVCVASNKAGEDGALFTNLAHKGSVICVTLKLNRAQLMTHDDDGKTLCFDFNFVNRVVRLLQIIPSGQQLQFEMRLTDDSGNEVSPELMGSTRKRPAQLLSSDAGRPIRSSTSQVRTKAVEPSQNRLDTVVFDSVRITSGVGSRFLHTNTGKFAFKVCASNVDLDRWHECFPGCEVPQALGEGFLVTTSRANRMENLRARKRKIREGAE
jgi:hypothetical protein